MQAVTRPFEAIRSRGPAAWIALACLVGIGFAYSSLLTLGTRFGFEKGVEYWLFRPGDNAPLVILVLAGWLFYRRAYRLRALPLTTVAWPWIAICVALAILLHGWAIYTRADDLKIPSLVFGIGAVLLARWGRAGLRAMWMPMVFLLFAVPWPAPLMLAVLFKLQMGSAQLAGLILYLLGVPVLISGDQIVRTTQTFQVIEGCSGLRSIETLSMLTLLLIDLFGRRGWHAALLVLLAPGVAFLLNGVRVVTLVLNPHSEIIAVHNLQGIALLLVGLLVIYGIDALIERFAGPNLPGPWRATTETPGRRYSPRVAVGTLVILAVATTANALTVPVWEEDLRRPRIVNEMVSDELADWTYDKIEPDYPLQGSTRFSEVVHRRYAFDDTPVTIYIGTADLGQRGGSVISPVTTLPGSGWMLRDAEQLSLGDPPQIVDRYVFEKSKQRMLVRHRYVGRRGLAEETWRTLLALDRSWLRRDELLYVVRLETPIVGRAESDRAAAEARLDSADARLADVWAALAEMSPDDRVRPSSH